MFTACNDLLCPKLIMALQEVAQHREWLSGKDIHGRIYISTQGINAQLSGPSEDAEGYAKWTQERQVWQVCSQN